MSCSRVCRLVDRSSEGELSVEERWSLDDHVTRCERCARYAEGARRLEAALDSQLDPPVREADVERTVQAVRAKLALAVEREAAGVLSPRFGRGLKLAAAAVVLIAIGAAAWSNLNRELASPASVGVTSVETADAGAGAGSALLPKHETELESSAGDAATPVVAGAVPADAVLTDAVVAPLTIEGVLGAADPLSDEALLLKLDDIDSGRSRLRLVESALFSDDLAVARGAARTLGLGRDRMSLIVLRRALLQAEDVDLRVALVDAVVAYESLGVPALARALDADNDSRATILAGLARLEGEAVAACLDDDWRAQLSAGRPAEAGQSLGVLLASDAGERAFDSVHRFRHEPERAFLLGALRNEPRAVAHFDEWLQGERVGVERDLAPVLWRFAELSETDDVQSWLAGRISNRDTRQRALRCLDAWTPRGALPVLLALESTRGLGSVSLIDRFADTLERDPDLCATVAREYAESVDRMGEQSLVALAHLSELAIAAGIPAAGPLLRELIRSAKHLETGQARWLAMALAEVGDAATGVQLAADLRAGLKLERLERAAVWIAVVRTAGTEALAPLLEGLTARARAEVLSAFTSPNTVGATRIARVLDRTLDPERTALLQ